MMLPFGFRIVGPTWERRRLVAAGAAFTGYCNCDSRIDLTAEAYLSAFCFGEDFRALLESTASTAGFSGSCWAPWIWFDLDRPGDLGRALSDAKRLTGHILERFPTLDDDDLLAFYSGSKGFHLGLPTCTWAPAPSADFHRIARRFAERLAESADVAIDVGVYDRVRAFRAPNSRHPKTGRHKRRLAHAELMGLSIDRILQLAERPEAFDVPAPSTASDAAAADWQAAEQWVAEQAAARAERHAAGSGTPTLNKLTLDIIRDGGCMAVGDRHRLLFSAAANLAECGCPPALAHALLTDAGLDAGLSPRDVRRQIDCGLARRENSAALPATVATPPPSPLPIPGTEQSEGDDLQSQLAGLWATPPDVDAAEREAIQWEGNQRWTPAPGSPEGRADG